MNSNRHLGTVPTFSQLLVRADETVLHFLLGKSTVRLMQATQGSGISMQDFRDALLEIRPPWKLLENQDARQIVLEMLYPDEVESLVAATMAPNSDIAQLTQWLSPNSNRFASLLAVLKIYRPSNIQDAPLRPSLQDCVPDRCLFPHQRDAMVRVQAALKMYPHRVLLHMPTGSGKTRTAMQVAAHHLQGDVDTTVCWLATSEELCEQAAQEFCDTWRHSGDRPVTLIRAWGQHPLERKDVLAPGPKFIVAGLSKLHSKCKQDQTLLPFLGDNVSLVIFDEAHQAVAPTYKLVTDSLLSRNLETQLLGLSATPGRSWNDVAQDLELSSYFGKSKVTLQIQGYTNPIDYLIERGYVAVPRFRQLVVKSTVKFSRAELNAVAELLDVPEDVREKLASDDLRNIQIVRACESLLKNHRRVLLFAATVAHAELLAMVLRSMGLAASSVTGTTLPGERARIINWFLSKDEEPRILANYGILTTGFDAPQTSAALIARPTKSLVLYSQMAGRALRGTMAGGNSEAEIVSIVDPSLPGFGDLSSAFTNWEDVW
jgi:DNA repair protein RadD